MALGFKTSVADSMLNTQFAGTWFLQLHTADPGVAATTAVANGGIRASFTFAASSGGVKLNNVAVTFTNVAAAATYTHFSLWSLGGVLGMTGTLTAQAVAAGADFTIPVGQLVVTLNVAA